MLSHWFENPWWLWGLLALAPIALWDVARRWESTRPRQIGGVALRSLMLGLIVVALAGPRWFRSGDSVDVVFLVDRSASIPDAGLRSAIERVEALRADLGYGDRAGLVLFDQRAEVVVDPTDPWTAPTALRGEPVQGTDLGTAVQVALGAIAPGASGRIVLLSDGRATEGDLATAISVAREAGVPIDTVAVHPSSGDPGVVAVDLEEPSVRPGQTVRGTVVVGGAGDAEVTGRLVVELDGEVVHEESVTIAAGGSIEAGFEYDLEAERDPGIVDLTATFAPDSGDVLAENNALQTGLVVGRRPTVWVISSDHLETRHLAWVLKAESMDVERVPPEALEGREAELEQVDLVILGNVPIQQTERGPAAIPEGFGGALRRYVSAGGGMITLGGDRAYDLGSWGRSEIGTVLPVELNPMDVQIDPAVTMVIILDKSGSMNEWAAGKTKMALANEGAVASMELLRSFDRIGVMSVDDRVQWVVEPQNVENRPYIARKIAGVRAGGGGIYVYTSLVAARKVLNESDTPLKHVILFSDARDSEEKVQGIAFGWGTGPNCYELAELMQSEGITVSIIGVGKERDQDAEFLELLAETGGGRYYLTDDATELRSLFVEETKQLVDSTVHEDAFRVRAKHPHPATEGIDFDRAPPLKGYLEVEARDTAQVVLTGPSDHPILTTWRYGLGQVASMSTDAGPRWASAWLGWEGYPKLYTQLARWALKGEAGGQTAVQLDHDGASTSIKVARRTVEGLAREDALRAELVELGADGRELGVVPVPMKVVEPGLWEADAATRPNQRYALRVTGGDGAVLHQQSFVAPPSDELRFASVDDGVLAAIADGTGGRREPSGEMPIVARGGVGEAWPLWWLFVLFALALLPVDSFLRRPARVV